MPIEELNLDNCFKITGTSVGAVGLKLRCCLKATPVTHLESDDTHPLLSS